MGSSRVSPVSIGLRLIIAIGIAVVTGPLATLFLFRDDVERQLAANFAVANAPLIRMIEARDDVVLSANRSSHDQLQARLASIENSIAALRQSVDSAEAESPAIREQIALVTRLEDAQTVADRDVVEAEELVTDELAGIPGVNRSGQAGEGLRYRAARTKLDQAKERVTAAAAALAEAQERLRQMREAAASQADTARAARAGRLAELLGERNTAQADLAKFDDDYRALVASRPDRIAAALAADPSHVPEAAGLTARLSALWQIALAHPENLAMLIGLHVVFIGLELLVMLSIGGLARAPTYTASPGLRQRASFLAVYSELQRLYDQAGFHRDGGDDATASVSEPVPEPSPPIIAMAPPDPEPEDGRSALARYFMTVRAQARRLEDEEAEAVAGRGSPVPKADFTPTTEPAVVKRGRGRPRGSKTRHRASPLNGSAELLKSAHPSREDNTEQNEAEEEKEEV